MSSTIVDAPHILALSNLNQCCFSSKDRISCLHSVSNSWHSSSAVFISIVDANSCFPWLSSRSLPPKDLLGCLLFLAWILAWNHKAILLMFSHVTQFHRNRCPQICICHCPIWTQSHWSVSEDFNLWNWCRIVQTNCAENLESKNVKNMCEQLWLESGDTLNR